MSTPEGRHAAMGPNHKQDLPMIDKYILHKDHLMPLLRRLGRDHRLVMPRESDGGDVFYAEATASSLPQLEARPVESLKPFFLPQREVLSGYAVDRQGENVTCGYHALLPESRPTVYFGVRSCDLMAVLYMDMIFLHGRHRDPWYARRRKDALFITLGCNTPFADCFCNATRTGPFLEFGFDLQLTDIGDHYFVETGKAGGDALVRRFPAFFRPATEEHSRAQFQAHLEARGRFQRLVHVEQCIARLRAGERFDSVMERLSARCADCGGCAYLCPTCTCYTIVDQDSGQGRGERLRLWDACTLAGFTRMAGDHNPVDMRRSRIERRFLHKLLHDVQRQGRTSCMGCGRCVGVCFGGVDIVRFITMVGEAVEARQEVRHATG